MDQRVKEFQQYLASMSPLGISYTGPIDGEMSAQLQLALKALELKIQAITNKPMMGMIVSGNKIVTNVGTIQQAINKYVDKVKQNDTLKNLNSDLIREKITNKKDEIQNKVDKTTESLSKLSNEQILAFQKFFSQQNPIIGKLYSGPIDGILNQQLINAAKQTESIITGYISKISEKSSVLGKLFSDKANNFLTSVEDLSSALSVIQQFQQKQK
jgi:deoxyxylulose-5-phosphate synthase